MSTDPLVSIVVPYYHKHTVVERTLQSVAGQSYTNWEIVVVDDGSSEESARKLEQICGRFPRTKIIRQDNQGPGPARNTGLDHCTGEYVCFLDADDQLMPKFLRTAISKLKEHPECPLFASSHFRTENGEPRNYTPYFKLCGVTAGPTQIHPSMRPTTVLGLVWFHHSSSVVCATSVVKKFGGFYAKKRSLFGEDIHLWLKVLLNERSYCHLESLTWYHTEDSDLCGATTGADTPAYLIDADDVRKVCPKPLQKLLEQFFGLATAVRIDQDIVSSRNGWEQNVSALPIAESDKEMLRRFLRGKLEEMNISQDQTPQALLGPTTWKSVVGPSGVAAFDTYRALIETYPLAVCVDLIDQHRHLLETVSPDVQIHLLPLCDKKNRIVTSDISLQLKRWFAEIGFPTSDRLTAVM